MEGQTVTDWLTTNKVSDENINFIESVLTFTSTVKVLTSKQELINIKLQSWFPNKKAEVKPNLTYQEFIHILKENGIEVDPDELINKYRLQGICVKLCNEWLTQKK